MIEPIRLADELCECCLREGKASRIILVPSSEQLAERKKAKCRMMDRN